MVKYQGPKGTGGLSVGGEFFPADEDGCIQVPVEGNYDGLLNPHGFTRAALVPQPVAEPVPEPQEQAAIPVDAVLVAEPDAAVSEPDQELPSTDEPASTEDADAAPADSDTAPLRAKKKA